MKALTYCKTVSPDGNVLFFALTAAQLFGEGEQEVAVCWEAEGRVFTGSKRLCEILAIRFEPC